ncbi:MAG: hypothetical protein LBE17_01255 [Treponema sp.]|jgi:hypothetical protein|nr:hypothetical protein [Treponema sp.]
MIRNSLYYKELTTFFHHTLWITTRNKSLADFTEGNGWQTIEFAMSSPMTHGHKTQGRKVEVLTGNYPIAVKPGAKSGKGQVSGEEG